DAYNWATKRGSYALHVSLDPANVQAGPGAVPANDNWANATGLAVPGTATGTNAGATVESYEPSVDPTLDHTVWYRVMPLASGTLTASTAGSDFDTVLALYGSLPPSIFSQLAINDDYGG